MTGLTRRKPLRRTGFKSNPQPKVNPTNRDVNLKSRSTLKPRSRVKPVSDKTLARRGERDEVRETTLARDGHRCVARLFVPGVACAGHLDVDESTGRGRDPGSQYDDTKTQTLCRRCHNLKTDNPRCAGLLGLHGAAEQLRRLEEEGAAGLRWALAEWARRKGMAAGRGRDHGGDQLAVQRFAERIGVSLPQGWGTEPHGED